MNPLEQRLAGAGEWRETAESERHHASVNLRDRVREASKAGMSKTRIAELAGVSRQTVHEMLREDNR